MHPQIKDKMIRNLRQFLNAGGHGLFDHQVEAMERVESFLRTPDGGPIPPLERVHDLTENLPTKKGDFFEVLSATGTGKTRMFGAMAKAMNVPALIVTPRNVLNKQTKKEFCEELGIPEDAVAVYDSQQSTAEIRRVLRGNPPPQFIVTSYQSLSSLTEKYQLDFTDPASTHYRPLVILDEFHESQGLKTVKTLQKLKNKVLLAGFTATDAGAASTLFEDQAPIYTLPIVEAIDRGLLCHGVRTGVIDVAIDQAWVKSFLNTPKGLDYRREEVERFARSPSVTEGAIRFHLQYQDAQLGKISRLPTIFYTQGVEAAREGAKEFNKRAQEMGLNVKAAYVSGTMRPAVYQPILDQFKRGEIQALWNDRLLGMGFNARNATVCYSLKPSRMPHIVEQQLGRICRPEGDDYHNKYGQDKVALAINVCGQGMNPFLYGEVLDEKPAIYKRDYSPLQTPVQGEDERASGFRLHLPDGINVHIDYNDMQSLLARTAKAREKLPEKTKEFLTATDMAAQSKGDLASIYDAYKALREAWEKAQETGAKTISAEGITIPTDKAGIFKSNSRYPFCVHEDYARLFARKHTVRSKTAEWLGALEMKERAGRHSSTILPLYKSLRAAWEKAQETGAKTFTADRITIPTDKAGIFRSGSQIFFCVHESMVNVFELPQKTPEWLGQNDMKIRAHRNTRIVAPLYKALQVAWEAAQETGAATITAAGVSIPTNKAGIFKSGRTNTFCLHESLVEMVQRYTPPSFSFADEVGERSIEPDSEHLKRAGRVRGSKE